MEYNFMWSSSYSGAPIVSIALYGITFNTAAIELIGKPQKIKLGYDNTNKVIGVKPICEEDENITHAFLFAERDRNGYIRIGNKDFVKYISAKADIDINKSNRYPAEWNNELGLLIVDLTKPLDNFEMEKNDEE